MTETTDDRSDMMDAVRAAVEQHSDAPQNVEHVERPESQEAAVQIGEQVAAQITADEQQRTEQSKNRDVRGRFAPKAQGPAEPPKSWTPEAKAEWQKLAPRLQEAVLKREMEITNGQQQYSDERKRLRELDTIIAPRREYYQRYGFKNDAAAINHLFALSDEFERDPGGAVKRTLQSMPPAHAEQVRQALGVAQSGPSQQQIQERMAAAAVAEAEARGAAKAEVRHWEKTAGEHYGLVKPLMQQLLETGAAVDLNDADAKACAQTPAVQSIEQQKRASVRRERQVRASNASLSGTPHGITPAPVRNDKASPGQFGDVADDVRAAVHSLL
jgi:hypothetical protein